MPQLGKKDEGEKQEERYVVRANPELGSHMVAVGAAGPGRRVFYQDPHAHPGGPEAQELTQEELDEINFGFGGVSEALTRY